MREPAEEERPSAAGQFEPRAGGDITCERNASREAEVPAGIVGDEPA